MQKHFRVEWPPRLRLESVAFGNIFLMAQPPLLFQEGNRSPIAEFKTVISTFTPTASDSLC